MERPGTAVAATWFRDAASKKQLRTFYEGLGGSDKSFSAMKLTLLLICNAKECTRSGISAWSCLRTSNPTNEYDQNLEPRCHAVKVSHRMVPWLNMTNVSIQWSGCTMYIHVSTEIILGIRILLGTLRLPNSSFLIMVLRGQTPTITLAAPTLTYLPGIPVGDTPVSRPPTWALTWVSTLVAGRKGWGFL